MKRIRETSRESYHQIPHTTRKIEVLRVLSDGVERTARQCSRAMHKYERNYTQPRLTALVDAGFAEVCRRTRDTVTDRTVSVYRITDDGRRWLDILGVAGCSKTGT